MMAFVPTVAYNPADWFWIVGGDETRVYSSGAGQYLPISDENYQAWVSRIFGSDQPQRPFATRIDTEESLTDVLAVYGLTFNP